MDFYDSEYRYIVDRTRIKEMIELTDKAYTALDALRSVLLEACGANLKGREDFLFKCQFAKNEPLLAQICEHALVEIENERDMLESIEAGDTSISTYACEGQILKLVPIEENE